MKQFSLAICAAIFLSACGGSSSVASSTTSGTSSATNGAGVTNASTVFNLPGTPTNVTGIAGDGSVTLNFMAPASDGGATIASYTATCMAGSVSRTISTTSSPVVVTGLLNGTKYSCNVAAVNAAGVGAVSSSVELTPVVATENLARQARQLVMFILAIRRMAAVAQAVKGHGLILMGLPGTR